MQPKDQNEQLKNMYMSRIAASYFKTVQMKDPTKSRIGETDKIIQEEENTENKVDENTFRINRNFKFKEDHYSVYNRKALVYVET